MNDRPSICFVAHFAYGAMTGGCRGHVGGVERQTSLMARWFAARGYQVSMLNFDEGQGDGVKIGGVRLLRMCREDAGIKGLRFFWPKWTSLYAAMKRADADIYYQNNAEYVTGQVAMWCRRHGRRFVYSVASNTECDVHLPRMRSFSDRMLYRYGLRNADKIVVQTFHQQDQLERSFGYNSVVLPMPCPGPNGKACTYSQQDRNSEARVLWIGRVCRVKRPDRLLDLAEKCPDIPFDFVGPAGNTDYSRSICRRAKTLSNVTIHGSVPRESVYGFYRKATLLCCTSDVEGFPNTFLEAWSCGLPIVTMYDPDNLVDGKGLGKVGKDVTELALGIRTLLDSSADYYRCSALAREYYLQHHTVDKALREFEKVFSSVASEV